MTEGTLPLAVTHRDNAALVRFTTSSLLDEDDVFSLGHGLLELADEVGHKPLVLVLDGFDFYRSMFLATLLRVLERRQGLGRRLIIVQAPESFSQQTFDVTGVSRKFEIHGDEDSALASL